MFPVDLSSTLKETWLFCQALRRRAAGLVAAACRRFGGAYENLQPRVTRQLLRALLDPARPLTTHYGVPH